MHGAHTHIRTHTHIHIPLMYIHASTCTHTLITSIPLGNGEGLMQVPPIDGLSLAPPRVHSNNALCSTPPSLFHASLHLRLASEEHRHKSHLRSSPHQGLYPRHLDPAFLPQLHIILLLPLSLPRHPTFLPLTTNHTPSPSPPLSLTSLNSSTSAAVAVVSPSVCIGRCRHTSMRELGEGVKWCTLKPVKASIDTS